MYTSLTSPPPAEAFHRRIYAGEILRFDALPAMAALVGFVRGFLEEALAPHPPVEIHRHLAPADQAERFAELGRRFSRSDETKRLWQAVFAAVGLDPAAIARDRLHLRFQPHQEPEARLPRRAATATIAFHRDTWGTNLYAQTNWWAPVYEITAGRTMALYPAFWDRPLRNTTAAFDLAEAMARNRAAGRGTADADEAIPHLAEPVDPALARPVVVPPGSVIAFSSAHAHAGVPNGTGLTRISLETRTLAIDDVRHGRGAPNLDGAAPWAAPGLFRRVSDGVKLEALLGCEPLVPYRPLTPR